MADDWLFWRNMGLVEKLIRGGTEEGADAERDGRDESALVDGALDTLGCVLRTMGEAAFPTARDVDPDTFLAECAAYARHVENGAAIPSAGIELLPDGGRDWSQVRRFFIDRRHDERDFVTERLGDYRAVVEDLVAGLRQIGEREQLTEDSIIQCLATIEQAVNAGGLAEIERAVSQAVQDVSETFARQREEYEHRINELNERMSSLRQDLVAAREAMTRDTLTEVFNRGAFDTGIEQCVNLYFMTHQPVTLVLIDLDHFKSINDRCGHAAGDAVLRAVGEALSRSFIRKSDLVSRYGGDEFAVILSDTSAANARPLLERFLARVREIEIPNGTDLELTCSVGYAEITASDDAKSLIDRADKALYEAKAAGRDRAACAAAAPEEE